MDLIHLAKARDKWWALVNGNEPSGAIKCWEYLDYLRTSYALKRDCTVELIGQVV
jgi:hypothetical protein